MSRFNSDVLCLVLLLSTALVLPARSELVHGFFTLNPNWNGRIYCGQRFDFSTRSVVEHGSSEGDICQSQDWDTDEYYLETRLRGNLTIVVGALEELTEAPQPFLPIGPGIQVGATYVIFTGDSLFAKFAVRRFSGFSMDVEYYVQMDGTRNLDQLLPVESTTWGRIKSLFD